VLWLEAQKKHVLLSKGNVGHNNHVLGVTVDDLKGMRVEM
jgi:hypothetical protein